ncbi:MAG: TetR/AcrR family transcriptional regulator [Acidobacteria bacterium]|nr:TetR/AcrR family transcriptional regulator [Acidobacteriota bacterium]
MTMVEDTRAGGPPPGAASSRDRMLVAAKALFAGQGYENTSTVAIARQAGTSESQLMKHFGSKEGLLEAIFEHAWQQIAAATVHAVEYLASPADKLTGLVNTMLTVMEKDPDLKLLLLLEGRRIRKEGHMVMLTGGYRQFVHTVDDLLGQMRAAGQLRPDVPIEGVRSALMGAFEGLMRDQLLAQRLGYPAHYSGRDLRTIFNAIVAAFATAPAAGAARRRARRKSRRR